MSGSYTDPFFAYPTGNGTFILPSGSNSLHGINHGYGSIDIDELWNQMYINPRPVIIICAYCKAHNALTNPTCVQCGAPMGLGQERR